MTEAARGAPTHPHNATKAMLKRRTLLTQTSCSLNLSLYTEQPLLRSWVDLYRLLNPFNLGTERCLGITLSSIDGGVNAAVQFVKSCYVVL
jgi:hypothetical protein